MSLYRDAFVCLNVCKCARICSVMDLNSLSCCVGFLRVLGFHVGIDRFVRFPDFGIFIDCKGIGYEVLGILALHVIA